MNRVIIAIIGMGPRGLSILERINAIHKIKNRHLVIELHLIDPRVHGQGIHTSEQSDHILLNTVACQITMFSDASVTDAGPIVPGLSILEWARQHCYREVNGKYFYLGSNDCNEINADAYLPRNMLGSYLSWVYREQLRELSPHIKVIRHQQMAHNITQLDDDMAAVQQIFFGYLPEFQDFADFKAFALHYLKTDIDDALQGNCLGAVKATTDVIRDIRDFLRYAVDYAGLTPASHKIFIERYCSIMNRIAVGPPLARNQQLLALLEAGIVEFAGGPKAHVEPNHATGRFDIISEFNQEKHHSSADILARARMDVFYPTQDKSAFISNLLSNGTIRPFHNGNYHPGGICIDQRHHPISRDGQSIETIWALGNIVEGANFYTYVLPRPGVNSRAIKDAGICVLELFEQIDQHTARKPASTKESLYQM